MVNARVRWCPPKNLESLHFELSKGTRCPNKLPLITLILFVFLRFASSTRFYDKKILSSHQYLLIFLIHLLEIFKFKHVTQRPSLETPPPVQLACVKHAANVHFESRKYQKCLLLRIRDAKLKYCSVCIDVYTATNVKSIL